MHCIREIIKNIRIILSKQMHFSIGWDIDSIYGSSDIKVKNVIPSIHVYSVISNE